MRLPAPGQLALFGARSLAWALLLMGWVGLGSQALLLAGSVLQAQALVALWLLALGAAAALQARWPRRGQRAALGAGALLAAAGLLGGTRGGGLQALAAALAGWALLLAAASAVVRARRLQGARPAAPPLWPAATGAAIAWGLLGDPADAGQVALRMAVSGCSLAVLLALLQPRQAAPGRAGCRAGLFDCSLPAWPAGAWRDLRRWPLNLAMLSMLPMMSSLPLLLAACRADGLGPAAVLGGHWLAMFGPALLLRRLPRPTRVMPWCAGLMAAGALAAWPGVIADPLAAMLAATAAQGMAWSLAWRHQLAAASRQAPGGPWPAAMRQALLVAVVGLWLAHAGPAGLLPLQAALGVAALAAAVLAGARHALAAASVEPAPR